jgi:predicted AlkP superfamily phosphohydrolase/phosphomutase
VDWPRTRAFSLNNQHGYIYLHRKDRFPQGLVSPGAEAEALCRSLTSDLEQLVDDQTGEKVVDRVFRVADLHPGPAATHLPDLLLLWKEGYLARAEVNEHIGKQCLEEVFDSNLLFGDIGQFLNIEQSGVHSPDGILIAHGPRLDGPRTIAGATIADLAPTLLHLLGEPVPQDMTGRVLSELFSPAYLAANPVRYAEGVPSRDPSPESPYSAEERTQVEQHLRELGYLE